MRYAKCRHSGEIFVTDNTGSCQNNNWRGSQWRKFRKNDISVSVKDEHGLGVHGDRARGDARTSTLEFVKDAYSFPVRYFRRALSTHLERNGDKVSSGHWWY